MNDRLRARAPPTDADAWTEATVRAVRREGQEYVVTVEPGGERVEVRLSAALFDLFAGRVDRPVEEPADVVGVTAWYR